jgi:hypothetical protein
VDAIPFDRAVALASAYALQAVEDLHASKDAPHNASGVATAHGWNVLVIVAPATPCQDERPDLLSECDRDCLAQLAQAKEPLSGVRVRRGLEKGGIGVWGIATVKRSLAKLRRLKLVSNSRRGARGYFLPETAPIVRKAG